MTVKWRSRSINRPSAAAAVMVMLCMIGIFSVLALYHITSTSRIIKSLKLLSQWSNLTGAVSSTSVDCEPGVPCSYPEVVDFRVIVITYNRAASVKKLLHTLDKVEVDGDRARLEIWIDRSRAGHVDKKTLEAVSQFNWTGGPTRVHVQKRHVGIYGQWIDTWSPRDHSRTSKEIAIILEDDISVSPYIYRWLKAVYRHYAQFPEFDGATLNSDEQVTHDGKHTPIVAFKNHTTYLYKYPGTWGMSPTPYYWHSFQTWYHKVRSERPDFRPYVPGTIATEWYKMSERDGTSDSMWETWLVYYCYIERLFTVNNNLPTYNGDKKSCLCINRREVGLHYPSKGREDFCTLLDHWKNEYVVFPERTIKLDWNGAVITTY